MRGLAFASVAFLAFGALARADPVDNLKIYCDSLHNLGEGRAVRQQKEIDDLRRQVLFLSAQVERPSWKDSQVGQSPFPVERMP
jgi:hypothetical protein